MADKKISQLTALSAANLAPSTDVLAIVDTSATETKKIVAQDLINGVLNVASAVGIGTASPTQKLTVAGNILSLSAAGTDGYVNAATNGVQNTYLGFNNSGSTNAAGALNNYSYVGNGNNYGVQIISNGSAVATFTNTGNVGIGTASPGYKLHVRGADATAVFVAGNTSEDTRLEVLTYQDDRAVLRANDTSNTARALAFETGTTERGRFTAGGELLVGTTNNSTTAGSGLKVSVGIYPRLSIVTDSSTTDTAISVYSTGATAYRFFVDPSGTIYATVTTISAISDQRYKENIRDLDIGLDAVMALKPRKFDWKAGKGRDKKDDRGFIAQEFEQVFPDLIDEWKDPAPEGEEPYKSVRQDLIPVLVKAMQEQQAMIEALKAKVSALEAK